MHLLFTQVHFSFDSLAGVNMQQLEESYPSAEVKSVYSTAQVDWTMDYLEFFRKKFEPSQRDYG